MNPKRFYVLCRTAVLAWIDDYAPSMGAAISYYTIFSMAPLLVIVIAIAGALFGHDAAQQQIIAEIRALVGSEGATVVESLLRGASKPGQGLVAGGIGIVVLLVGATTVFTELQSALDRIWHVPERDKPSGVWAVVRQRLLSFGLILGLGFLLIVTLIVSAALTAVDHWFGGFVPGWELVLRGLNEAFALAVLTLLFAVIFKMMPSARIAWRDVWTGAWVTALLFEVGKLVIGQYLGRSGFQQSFAAAGSLVVFIAWVYYAAQIFLLGAEFTKAYADAHGSLSAPVSALRGNAAVDSASGAPAPPALPPVPIPAALGVLRNDREAVREVAAAQREIGRRVDRATAVLARQLLVLGVVGASNYLLENWTRRQRKARHGLRADAAAVAAQRSRAKRRRHA